MTLSGRKGGRKKIARLIDCGNDDDVRNSVHRTVNSWEMDFKDRTGRSSSGWWTYGSFNTKTKMRSTLVGLGLKYPVFRLQYVHTHVVFGNIRELITAGNHFRSSWSQSRSETQFDEPIP